GEIVKVCRGAGAPAQEGDAIHDQKPVGPAGQVPGIVDQGDADDLVESDGDDEEVIAPQVDDGPGDHVGKEPGGDGAGGKQPRQGHAVPGGQSGRGVRADGEKGRVAHVEQAHFAQDEVEAEAQERVYPVRPGD